MKKKKDGIQLILTESQFNDPKMQELISKSDGVEIISDEKLQKMIENMVPFEEDDDVGYVN